MTQHAHGTTASAIRLAATGAIALVGLAGASACTQAVPSEGSGEVQDMKEVGQGIAEQIEINLRDAGDAVPEGSPVRDIDEVENVAADSVRVVTSETLTDAERERLVDDVFRYGAEDIDALRVVQVVDGSGEETLHERS
ncbi:hypothetical protein [Leucobacter massiliensis]|uniref:Uncharacterized protein n=1 Tax=Leucobacter massiliensis TaxID=1686285 RepID=A0A2S9QNP1_9MICO|nr:hypothetical protein [Leucobacter massiliensis]PRI11196.1 hypothetical protein B4915_10100 [Leucobacter massiliensis]